MHPVLQEVDVPFPRLQKECRTFADAAAFSRSILLPLLCLVLQLLLILIVPAEEGLSNQTTSVLKNRVVGRKTGSPFFIGVSDCSECFSTDPAHKILQQSWLLLLVAATCCSLLFLAALYETKK